MVTIRDVARRARVSIPTVSHALNGYPDVSAETRQRVIAAAEELGYRPSIIARGLVSRKTSLLGVIVPNAGLSFYPEVLQGIEDEADRHGYSIILGTSEGRADRERNYLRIFREKRVEGMLLAPIHPENLSLLQELEQEGYPVVFLIQRDERLGFPAVMADAVTGSREAVKYLISLGHRRIVHLASFEDRLIGYRQALEEAGIPIDPALIRPQCGRWEAGYAVTREMLESGERFTAIFAFSDMVAMGAMKALYERGFRVPDDVSIIGFDDIALCDKLPVPLTTVFQPKYEKGVVATQKVIQLIQGATVEDAILPTRLVIRESTGPCRG